MTRRRDRNEPAHLRDAHGFSPPVTAGGPAAAGHLRASDSAAIDALIAQLEVLSDLERFGRVAAEALLELVPGISATYTEVNAAAQRAFAVIVPDPDDAWWIDAQPIFERFAHQHPVLIDLAEHGPRGATTWEDVTDVEAFHRTDLYREFYAPLGIGSQLLAPLPAPEGVQIALAVNRGSEGFDARDRAILDVLRARVLHAYRTVQLRADRVALHAALAGDGWQVVLVDGDGRVVADTDEGVGLADAAGLVPAELRRALRDALAAPTRPTGPPRRSDPVRITTSDGAAAPAVAALVVPNTVPPHVVLVRRPTPVEQLLRDQHGLTRRQAEVAVGLADGRSNHQLGIDLGISPATVKKHLEAIYRALDVGSRAEAVALVGRVANAG
ncbi:MAG: helix-turn-helix transcriptional regulator [Actinobacteria bacterium]|nr:helix-turn-helix transcriptional regulator [Actinomycetota bacterium]